MISSPWVKKRILELMVDRPGMTGVSLLYGPPSQAKETTGDDPLYRCLIGFNDPVGDHLIEEMCGPSTITYEEEYSIEFVVQVIARNRDAGFYEVEQKRAEMVYQLSRVLQDPTLGYGPTSSPFFSRPRVTLGEFLGVSGWLNAGQTDVAATRAVCGLEVVAHIEGEA